MKFNTTRKTKIYQAGDEVTAQISEVKETNGNLGFKLFIVENGVVGSNFFYHSIGAYQGKGAYYFDLLLNHLQVPENIEIDEKWFIGKRVQVILGSYTNPSNPEKTYLNIASYVKPTGDTEKINGIDPFINGSDLTADVPFDMVGGLAFEKPATTTKKKKKETPGENTGVDRPDFMTLIQEE